MGLACALKGEQICQFVGFPEEKSGIAKDFLCDLADRFCNKGLEKTEPEQEKRKWLNEHGTAKPKAKAKAKAASKETAKSNDGAGSKKNNGNNKKRRKVATMMGPAARAARRVTAEMMRRVATMTTMTRSLQ